MCNVVFLTQMSVSSWKVITIERTNFLCGLPLNCLYYKLDAKETLLRIKRALIS